MITAQLRHCAAPQPNLVPVMPEIFAQKIVHRQFVAHFDRAVRAAVDRERQSGHASTPLSMAWVTGSDWKR